MVIKKAEAAMRSLMLAALLALSGCAGAAQEPNPATLIEDGRVIVQSQCGACHAVAADGASPNPHAPPLRTVLANFSADALEEELIEGIQVAHPMPQFHVNPQAADALIAYLKSIQTEPSAL